MLAILILAVLILSMFPLINAAGAGPEGMQCWNIGGNEICFTTPDTREQCIDAPTSDTLFTTGVPDNWRLLGQVIVAFVPDGNHQVHHQYNVDQYGDLNLLVEYPPVSQWPPHSNGTRELHVDIQIEVLDDQNVLVHTLGPGQDWDLFCLGQPDPTPTQPPPPPPTATHTPVPPTSTPTNTPVPPTNTPTPPPAGQGCTPGYWKNHTQSWPPTGYSTGQAVDSVFSRTASAPYVAQGDATLLQALSFRGGSTIQGAAQILLRASVAAILNAAHPNVNYPRSVQAIVDDVNAALNTQNRDTILNLATALDNDNNRGCPLN
jgi:hypothetical protein